jgi:Cu(I)/Ag(I) efflux system membrane fusion protein
MRYIIFISIFILNLDAKIITSKQLFNTNIIQVKQLNISQSKTFYGNTLYDETKINDIVLRYNGFIKNLKANYKHKYIKKGDKLFEIYSKEVSIALDELIMAVQYQNAKELIDNIEERLALLDISKNTINKVKRTLKIPYYIDIQSKYKGVIINRAINESSYVKAGQTLLQIADLSNIWVDAQVYQKDLPFIKKGMKATIDIEGVGSFESKVELIHPIVENKTKTIPVRLSIANNDMNIYPNMFAKITFTKVSKSMIVLPKSAVITKANKHYVFKPLPNNQFEPIEIVAKRLNSNQFQIVSGLLKGDKVINNALFMLDSDAVTNGLYEDDDDDW